MTQEQPLLTINIKAVTMCREVQEGINFVIGARLVVLVYFVLHT